VSCVWGADVDQGRVFGSRRVGVSCGRARLNAVDEKEMVQPLDGVQVELCGNA
jgi:hypothetical protein